MYFLKHMASPFLQEILIMILWDQSYIHSLSSLKRRYVLSDCTWSRQASQMGSLVYWPATCQVEGVCLSLQSLPALGVWGPVSEDTWEAPEKVVNQHHGTFVKTKKPASVHYYSLSSKLHLAFTNFSTNVLFLFQEPIRHGA